jgi:hypothetical protein
MSQAIINQVVKALATLPDPMQRQVLEYVRTLTTHAPSGVPGPELLRFAGAVPRIDLERIGQAIEEDCERVDKDEW